MHRFTTATPHSSTVVPGCSVVAHVDSVYTYAVCLVLLHTLVGYAFTRYVRLPPYRLILLHGCSWFTRLPTHVVPTFTCDLHLPFPGCCWVAHTRTFMPFTHMHCHALHRYVTPFPRWFHGWFPHCCTFTVYGCYGSVGSYTRVRLLVALRLYGLICWVTHGCPTFATRLPVDFACVAVAARFTVVCSHVLLLRWTLHTRFPVVGG